MGETKKIGKKAIFEYEALPHHCVFFMQFSEGNGDPKILLWNNHEVFTPHFSTVINEIIFWYAFMTGIKRGFSSFLDREVHILV